MTPEESAARTAQRRRIFLKLETLCGASPYRDIAPILNSAMERHGKVMGTWAYWATDAEMEEALDKALAEDGATVSGGRKS